MGYIKELQNCLLSEISLRIREYGFEDKPKGQGFHKRIPCGLLIFYLSFIKHQTDIDVTAGVAIRFDELEELINEYKPFLSKAQKGQTASLGVELGNLSEGRQKRWTIVAVEDVGFVCSEIMSYFVRFGLPYLEKYSDKETALNVLSGDDREAWLHSPFHDERAMRAVGLAFLLGFKERFQELAAVKTDFLITKEEQGLQRFLNLKEALVFSQGSING